jgi:signal transduction histidine kinase
LQGALRGGALTQSLLALSRKYPTVIERVNANKLIKNIAAVMRRTAGERVAIDLALASDLWPIEVDANELESSLVKLVVNARDAMPDGGSLRIESRNVADREAGEAETLTGHYVMLTVTDSGCGMPADVVRHAFEPFFTTKPEAEGSGLGLSHVYNFVQRSKGYIKIASEIGKGTSIQICLPRALAEKQHNTEAEIVAPAANSIQKA